MQRFALFLVFGAWALLNGCTSTRVLMPTPNLYADGHRELFAELAPELETNTVELVYVTDRLPEADETVGLRYGYHRSASAAFGVATVEIGEELSWDELVAESLVRERRRKLPLRIVSIEELGRFPPTPHSFDVENGEISVRPEVAAARDRAAAGLRRLIYGRLAMTPKKEVVVFVHGYNNHFDDAAHTLAELWHFLGREGVPVLYTWPAGRGGWNGYAYDRESGEFTIYHLKQLLRTLAAYDEVEQISIVAHSRGTDVVSSALRELVIEHRGRRRNVGNRYKLNQVVVAAPDLDAQVVGQRLAAEHVDSAVGRLTVYTSQGDKALRLSTMLFNSLTRLGRAKAETLDPELVRFLDETENIDFVDNRSRQKSFIGHGYFHSDPAGSSDVINVIRYDLEPGVEHGRPLAHVESRFWYFTDSYPAVSGVETEVELADDWRAEFPYLGL